MNSPHTAQLLVVDDESALMVALCRTLETEGYAATGVTSASEALALLRKRQFDLLLTDMKMPEMDGIALLHAAQEIDRDLVGILMTGHGTIDTAVKALRGGALDYILKPFRLDNLLPVLTRALATRRLQTENIRLREAVSIYELARVITTGLSHADIVQRTVASALQHSDAGAACVLVPTEEGGELQVSGMGGVNVQWPQDERLAIDGTVERWVAAAREQLSAWDGSSPIAILSEPPFKGEQVGVALPIVADGHFHGVLRFSTLTPQRRLNPGQIKALSILASTAATAFEAASLLAQLRGLNQKLEQRVEERTRELEATNADLEAFSYSVSHDLRAPLRTVEGFCQIFMSDFGSGVPPEGLGHLNEVCAGVARMNQLIEDLLRFARFSRTPLDTQRVSIDALVRRVAASLQRELQGRSVDVHIAEMPECFGDRSLLEQVFTNLLSNAFKFTAGTAHTRIEVGTFAETTQQVFFVKDNGVGFNMKYSDKLFGVFQRLHSQSDFEGTGIGLSIVQRIIKRHGGRVWAESRPQEGATFYFSLPLRSGTERISESTSSS